MKKIITSFLALTIVLQCFFAASAYAEENSADSGFEFIAKDESTNGAWEGKYGSDGYFIPGYASGVYDVYYNSTNIDKNIRLKTYYKRDESIDKQTNLIMAPSYLDAVYLYKDDTYNPNSVISGGNLPTVYEDESSIPHALNRPSWQSGKKLIEYSCDSNVRIVGRRYDVAFYANDAAQYNFTAYFVANASTTATSLPISIRDSNDNILASTVINPSLYTTSGVYITFKVKGDFRLSFTTDCESKTGTRYGFAGYFFDPISSGEQDLNKISQSRLNLTAYSTAIEGNYAYSIKDSKTIVMTDTTTGTVIKTYKEQDSSTSFPTTEQLNTLSADDYISVSEGRVCVLCSSFNTTTLPTAKNAARIIDFTNAAPTAVYAAINWNNNGTPDNLTDKGLIIKVCSGFLYMSTIDGIKCYDLNGLYNGKYNSVAGDKVTGSLVNENNGETVFGPAVFAMRNAGCVISLNLNNFTIDDPGTTTSATIKGAGHPANITECNNIIDGRVFYTVSSRYDANGNMSVIAASVNSGATSSNKNLSTHAIIKYDQIKNDAEITTFDSRYAYADGSRIYIVNNGANTSDADNSVIVYSYTSGVYPAVYQGKVSITGYKITAAALYNGYLAVGATDNKIHMFNTKTLQEVKVYDLGETPRKFNVRSSVLCVNTDAQNIFVLYGDVSVSDVYFIYSDNNVKVYTNISNNTSGDKLVSCFLAIYEDSTEDELKYLSYSPITVSAGDNNLQNVLLNGSSIEDDDSVSFMVWDKNTNGNVNDKIVKNAVNTITDRSTDNTNYAYGLVLQK